MKLIEYYYYRLFTYFEKSSVKEISRFSAAVFVGVTISINLIIINALLAKLEILPFLLKSKSHAVIFIFSTIVLSSLYFLINNKCNDLIKKYSTENFEERKRGNLLVVSYIIVSFLLIFLVAFFKPGKL
jgi:hypothetical protein